MNQAVADLYVAHIALHQVHWYMRGRGFMVWHPKMDEYMDSLDGYLDEISERLITLGGKPYSTLTEFLQHSEIEEGAGEFRNVEESDDVTNDIFVGAKADLEKTVWMLAAELGQTPGL